MAGGFQRQALATHVIFSPFWLLVMSNKRLGGGVVVIRLLLVEGQSPWIKLDLYREATVRSRGPLTT